jgi:hypothetical protein
MATTHDMRYERDDSSASRWSWLLPLAILAIAAIALASYLNRDTTNTTDSLNIGGNSTPSAELNTPATLP